MGEGKTVSQALKEADMFLCQIGHLLGGRVLTAHGTAEQLQERGRDLSRVNLAQNPLRYYFQISKTRHLGLGIGKATAGVPARRQAMTRLLTAGEEDVGMVVGVLTVWLGKSAARGMGKMEAPPGIRCPELNAEVRDLIDSQAVRHAFLMWRSCTEDSPTGKNRIALRSFPRGEGVSGDSEEGSEEDSEEDSEDVRADRFLGAPARYGIVRQA